MERQLNDLWWGDDGRLYVEYLDGTVDSFVGVQIVDCQYESPAPAEIEVTEVQFYEVPFTKIEVE